MKISKNDSTIHNLTEFKIELTYKCNLNCLHCSSEGSMDQIESVTYNDFIKIIDSAHSLGVKKISLSGGEPLLWKDLNRIFQYDKVQNFENGVACVRKGDFWGMINVNGEVILELKYKKIGDQSEGMMFIREGELIGFVDLTGAVVIQPKYQAVHDFFNGFAAVKIKNAWGMIDKTGSLVIPTENSGIKDVVIVK